MCIEMCIGLILEHVEMALLLVAWLVVLFPSPLLSSPDQSAIFAVSDFLYYLNSSLQTFRNRRNTSPFCCK